MPNTPVPSDRLLGLLQGLLLSLLAICLPTHAQTSGNLLLNPQMVVGPAGSGAPPRDWNAQFWVSGGQQNGPELVIGYTYGTDADGQPKLDVDVTNTSASQYGYFSLFMRDWGHQVAVTAGSTYTVSASLLRLDNAAPMSVGIGFHLWGSSGYMGEAGTSVNVAGVAAGAGAASTLASFDYVAGNIPSGGSSNVPTAVSPRLSFYGIAPGAHFKVRVKLPSLVSTPPLSAIEVLPLSYTTPAVAPGKLLKLTVNLQSRPTNGPLIPALLLVDDYGQTVRRFVKRVPADGPATVFGTGAWARSIDPWQFTLPADVPEGRYSLRYQLLPANADGSVAGAPLSLLPGPGVAVSDGPSYEIGQLTVARSAGLYVGQHFHRVPGSSENGPVLVPYHFTRSHDNDAVGGTQWWTGQKTTCEEHTPGACATQSDYNWPGVDTWANYHAQPGDRKLLLTFFGSPTWASARPTEASPYCTACGLSAEPAARYMGAYRQMVTDTVTRYRDRLFGVECWNEPYWDANGQADAGAFFTGTPTALADVCKALYQSTKAVDPSIPVFCPQSYNATGLAQVLAARTSQGEPMHQFCDVIGFHAYDAVGADTLGRDYASSRMADVIRDMRQVANQAGVNKPLAITEWGVFDQWYTPSAPYTTRWNAMSGQQRGELLYQMLATAQELGVTLVALYSYDDTYQGIWRGVDAANRPIYDTTQAAIEAQALGDFGRPLPPRSLQVLDLSQTLSPNGSQAAPLQVGDTLNLLLRVGSSGLLDLPQVQLQETLPDGAQVLGLSSSQGQCGLAGGSVSCSIGALPVGSSATVSVSLRLRTGGQLTSHVAANDSSGGQGGHTTTSSTSDLPITVATPPATGEGDVPALPGVAPLLLGGLLTVVASRGARRSAAAQRR